METKVAITPVIERERTSNGPLLIFGQGPVIDRLTRGSPQITSDLFHPENADVNFWSINMALAGAELYKRGQVPAIIVMGGRTGGNQYKSEAELIGGYLIAAGVPEDAIIYEKSSSDTIANLINLGNMSEEKEKQAYQLLCTPFHLARTKILMQLLKIPFDPNSVFASDEVLRFAARDNIKDASKLDKELTEIEKRLSPKGNLSPDWKLNPKFDELTEVDRRLSSRRPSFYDNQQGLEKRDYFDRLIHDDLWTRELLEYPESWLGRVAEINSPSQRDEILEQAEKLWPGDLQNSFGINRQQDSPEQIRVKLGQIQKKGLTPEDIARWIVETQTVGWPKEVEARLETLIQYRRQRN